jgi:pimeloyl-ACP methyl ester carboxylesterase
MNKYFISIDGIQLAYIEKNQDRLKTLFFIHGNSCSSRIWYKQFDNSLLSDYRLICLDLPGHGDSDGLKNDEDYNLLFLGDLLSKAINALTVGNEYILAGFSFGANIVAEMICHALTPSGIVIISPTIVGGTYTLNDTLKAGADPTILFTDEPLQNDIIAFMRNVLLSTDKTDFLTCLEDFNAVKKPFRSAILKTSIAGKLSNEILNLTQYDMPVLVLFGEEDKIVNPDYLDNAQLPLWGFKIFKLDEAGHYPMLDKPDSFVASLSDYCGQMFK